MFSIVSGTIFPPFLLLSVSDLPSLDSGKLHLITPLSTTCLNDSSLQFRIQLGMVLSLNSIIADAILELQLEKKRNKP